MTGATAHARQKSEAKAIGRAWACVLVFAASFLAYLPALHGGLLWNDSDYVTAPELRSVHGLFRIWFELGATQQYYPVLHSAFWVEHRLWGEATSGYHAVNILLHATSACLFGWLLRRLIGLSPCASTFGAFLFALHPVCAESVAWITEQKNTLSTVFYLLSAIAYTRWRLGPGDRSRRGDYILASVLFLAAALSKSVAATLPAALLVVLWLRNGKLEFKRDLLPLLPWLALGAAIGLFTGWVEKQYIGAQGAAFSLTLVDRGLIAGRAVWFYLGKLLLPVHLVFFYPRWKIDPSAAWQYLYPIDVLLLMGALWLLRKRSRAPLAATLIFIGSLFPTLGFLNVYAFVFSFVADHWQYLAVLPVAALAAAGWDVGRRKTIGTPLAWIPYAGAASLVIILGLLTYRESGMYRSSETLYRTTIARNSEAFLAYNNLGYELQAEGKVQEAEGLLKAALRIKPDYDIAHNNLGNIWLQANRIPEAIAEYTQAVRLRPHYVIAQYNLGIAYARAGQLPEAIEHWRQALTLKPDDTDARVALGSALSKSGRLAEAVSEDETALRLAPDNAEAHFQLGSALEAQGKLGEATSQYRQALLLRPDYAEAEVKLSAALADSGNTAEAMARIEHALSVQPSNPEAHNNRGILLARSGRLAEAAREFEEALRLDPHYAEAQRNLDSARRFLQR